MGRPKGDTARIRELREKGLSNRQIAQRFGLSAAQVGWRLGRYGIRSGRMVDINPWTDEEKSWATDLFAQGVSYGAIADLLGRTRNSVAGAVWRTYGKRSQANV